MNSNTAIGDFGGEDNFKLVVENDAEIAIKDGALGAAAGGHAEAICRAAVLDFEALFRAVLRRMSVYVLFGFGDRGADKGSRGTIKYHWASNFWSKCVYSGPVSFFCTPDLIACRGCGESKMVTTCICPISAAHHLINSIFIFLTLVGKASCYSLYL